MQIIIYCYKLLHFWHTQSLHSLHWFHNAKYEQKCPKETHVLYYIKIEKVKN